METVSVLDFETTGLSPTMGDRVTEIAITRLKDGQIIDRFQSLMNAGRRIPAEVTGLTGISNAMIASAPPVEQVMREALKFVGKTPVVAHNASFDKRFWDAEFDRLSLKTEAVFACTLLLSRRIYQQAANHRLSTLVALLGLSTTGRAHRAMVDAEMTSHLWARLQHDMAQAYPLVPINHALLMRVQKVARAKVPLWLHACCA